MSRTPLALQYRPRRFDQVVGQEHVTSTLRNALRGGRVGSAYLFAGPRGSGKTTTARLLARALNCTALDEGEPCGACDNCVAIVAGRSLDVMEIDAASNRGIEDVRELRERVGYAAVQGSRKIYIVDEVHMLSKDAFNALLKTIEEPPPHVAFIFATTDPQKVLPTVVSRCQRFDFRRIAFRDVEARLREVCDREGCTITPEATFLIAKKADGSLRDALGMLDQVLSLGEVLPGAGESAAGDTATQSAGPVVDAQKVHAVLGLAGLELYLAATDAVRSRDPAAAIRFVRRLVHDGVDLIDFYGGLYEHLRNVLLFALGDESTTTVPPDFHAAYRETAGDIGLADLLRATGILTEYEEAFRGTAHPEYMLEFLLVRLALLDRTADVMRLLEDVRTGGGTAAAPASPPVPPVPPVVPAPGRASRAAVGSRDTSRKASGGATLDVASLRTPDDVASMRTADDVASTGMVGAGSAATADSTSTGEPGAAWESVLESVSRRKASLGGMLAGLDRPALEGDELVLNVPGDQAFVAQALGEAANRRLLEDVLASVWGGPRRLRLELGSAIAESGSQTQAFRRLEREDPLIRKALEVFDADLV
ncbi:MAG: DNA polymerase III subunit gamma/tau [Gemmatimonadetes bacterium]|nr:DNA polymerase III subunit gamma/tau [Gemmatimonadota bacterium]